MRFLGHREVGARLEDNVLGALDPIEGGRMSAGVTSS